MKDQSDEGAEEMTPMLLSDFYIIQPVILPKQSIKFDKERRCKTCGAKLSQYNPDEECWPCQGK